MKRDRRTQLPAPWYRIADGAHGKTGARYAHPAGYRVEHCGHPTALWPYALYGPDGQMILAPNGRAWQKLAHIALEVERRLKSAPRCKRPNCDSPRAEGKQLCSVHVGTRP